MMNLRRVLACLILLAVLVLAIVIWRHGRSLDPVEVLEALPEQVDLSLEKLHYTQNEEGRRSWTLDAERAEYQRDTGLAELGDLSLTLYESGRFGDVSMTAEHGTLQQEQRLVEAWGNVVVTTATGERLTTERLIYDGGKKLLTTDEPVTITNRRMELKGTGLQGNLEQGRMLLKKDIWMLLLPEERKAESDE
ncbi:LPS export ABC transporter protein LptC [Malonomonas rubra DSM 5091]|uniref:LPS export ABC transporter protein LptC n=1 Tax=Malonomonas rubra DSM 5091 TaxID=1122189 RepID=A0A1M6DY80_MALRU|nr:LPS export ABC transporter periplasmic protein LptC [Malonomonas rubra]SHI78162.1 LPS export ABC transporter protein LptC [Malonomonas rubra DSM 5091]